MVKAPTTTEEVLEYLLPAEGDEVVAEADAPGEELNAEEETEPQRTIATPQQPTKAEIDHHWMSHLPFRNWCPVCVEGRGRERPHFRERSGQRRLPTVCFDYFFISKKGEVARQDW